VLLADLPDGDLANEGESAVQVLARVASAEEDLAEPGGVLLHLDVGQVAVVLLVLEDAFGHAEESLAAGRKSLGGADHRVPGGVEPLVQLQAAGAVGEHPPGCAGNLRHLRS